MDVVLVTKEPSVKLLGKAGLRYSTGKKGDFRAASPTHEATLLSSIVRLSTGRQPAALASGYIDPPPKGAASFVTQNHLYWPPCLRSSSSRTCNTVARSSSG